MKVLLVRVKYNHLSNKSGYDVIFNGLDPDQFISVYFSFRHKKIKKIINKILSIAHPRFFNADYRFEQYLHELDIAKAIRKHKPDVVHVTHAHDEFKIISKAKYTSQTKFIASIHLPYVFWKTGRKKLGMFVFYDKILVLDNYSQQMFARHFGDKVFFTPHPVDTQHYYPTKSFSNTERKETFHCLFLGRFMRNIEMVLEVIQKLYIKDKSIQFHFSHPVIFTPALLYYKMLGVLSLPTVHYYTKISDEMMLKYFRELDVLVTPLFESTANNVYLEAAACGMPVVSTKTNGTYDYLPDDLKEEFGELYTAEDIVEAVLKLRNDAGFYNKVSQSFYEYTHQNLTLEHGKKLPFELYRQYSERK